MVVLDADPRTQPKVLLVDDQEAGLLSLESVLKGCGYDLVRAKSGAEALSHLLHNDFAVILLDVQMPGMTGFETATYIKKRERTRSVPIIFVTGVDKDERFVTHGYEAGAVDYLFKPFEPQILKSKVAVFAELYNQRQLVKASTEKLAANKLRDQARVLEQLELESRVRYRNLADAIPHIVWKASADLSVDYFNRTWTQYTGFSLEQSCGAGWMSAFHPEDLPLFMDAWKGGRDSKSGFEVEARILKRDSECFRWHLVKAVAEQPVPDVVSSWLITCTEIHTQKEAEAELIKAKLDADTANRAKSSFLANMSHEIRTPLGAILGFSDLLLQPDLQPEDRIAHVRIIKRNGEQLLNVINEVLDISKIESGSLSLSRDKVELRELISSVEASTAVQAARKGLKVAFSGQGLLPEYIYSDATRTRQILINLVGNAVKFTSEGSIQVVIQYNKMLRQLSFEVKDTGPGIHDEHLQLLFRPFSQGDASTARKYGGTGLGLAISRKLARALGGDLQLLSTQVGIGSTFEFLLPVGTVEALPMIQLSGDGVEGPLESEQDLRLINKGLEGVRVLVADDAVENQMLISAFLGKAGATVELAVNGEEAVEKASCGDFHVVLMDIQMPKVDGYEATLRLRQLGYGKPIVAVTAHAFVSEKEKCLKIGCSDYLAKPINPHELVRIVSNHAKASLTSTVFH